MDADATIVAIEKGGEQTMTEPIVSLVNFSHYEPDNSARDLICNDGWVGKCKSDMLGLDFQSATETLKDMALAAVHTPLSI